MINWYVDEHKFLRGFPYHDGLVNSLTIEKRGASNCVRIAIDPVEDDIQTVIHLKGVVFLSAIHYMEGNIVCDLYLFKYSELTPQRREKLKLEDSSAYRDALVFLLESSYGVWLVAVFDTLLVERLPPSPKGTADTI